MIADTGVYGLGGDHWSEFAFIHNYLRATLNTTDLALDALPGHGAESFFNDMYVIFSVHSLHQRLFLAKMCLKTTRERHIPSPMIGRAVT